jgi:hypothetical protein
MRVSPRRDAHIKTWQRLTWDRDDGRDVVVVELGASSAKTTPKSIKIAVYQDF